MTDESFYKKCKIWWLFSVGLSDIHVHLCRNHDDQCHINAKNNLAYNIAPYGSNILSFCCSLMSYIVVGISE